MAWMARKYAGMAAVCAVAAFCWTSVAEAALVIRGTRIIYPAQEREVSIQLENKGKDPILVQSWLDLGDATVAPSDIQVPFTLSPPIVRLDGDKRQVVRMVYSGDVLPPDRESVFWINFLEVPPKAAGDNYLQFTYRTRLKVFFRPQALTGEPALAPKKMQWRVVTENGQRYLEAQNPTPFFVSLFQAKLAADGAKPVEVAVDMVKPFSSERFLIKRQAQAFKTGALLQFQAVSDFGGTIDAEARLQ